MELWFTERHTPNVKFSIRVDRRYTARRASFSALIFLNQPSLAASSPWTAI